MWFDLGIYAQRGRASARAEYRAARARRRAAGGRPSLAWSGWPRLPCGRPGRDRAGLAASACRGVLLAGRLDVVRPRPRALAARGRRRGGHGPGSGRLPARRWVGSARPRIPGSRANLDHLVIGPSGVWVVDTKATRSRVRAGWGHVRFGDRRLDPGPTQVGGPGGGRPAGRAGPPPRGRARRRTAPARGSSAAVSGCFRLRRLDSPAAARPPSPRVAPEVAALADEAECVFVPSRSAPGEREPGSVADPPCGHPGGRADAGRHGRSAPRR